jgi:hypothetical protein
MSKKPTVQDLRDAIMDLAGGLDGLTKEIEATRAFPRRGPAVALPRNFC